jgi:hypothetical protein
MYRIVGYQHKQQLAKNEPPCYNDERNQLSGAAMIVCPITEIACMQILSCSCPANYQEDALWPKKSPVM